MKNFTIKLLNFFSLTTDDRSKLSLTNIVLYVVIFKIALTQNVTLPELGTLLLSLLSYSHKRYVADKASARQSVANTELSNQVNDLTKKVSDFSKLAQETQSIITNVKLNQGQKRY